MICEHEDEHNAEYADVPDENYYHFGRDWCGDKGIHNPHEDCLGIMCDYGCNAEEF